MSKYAILVCFLACTVSVAAQEGAPSIPDVDEWKVDKSFNLDPKIDDIKIAFLGEVKEYRNPRDPNEFVRKVSKHLALISMRRLTKQNEHFMFIDVMSIFKLLIRIYNYDINMSITITGY